MVLVCKKILGDHTFFYKELQWPTPTCLVGYGVWPLKSLLSLKIDIQEAHYRLLGSGTSNQHYLHVYRIIGPPLIKSAVTAFRRDVPRNKQVSYRVIYKWKLNLHLLASWAMSRRWGGAPSELRLILVYMNVLRRGLPLCSPIWMVQVKAHIYYSIIFHKAVFMHRFWL